MITLFKKLLHKTNIMMKTDIERYERRYISIPKHMIKIDVKPKTKYQRFIREELDLLDNDFYYDEETDEQMMNRLFDQLYK